jgi:hypothetical protein
VVEELKLKDKSKSQLSFVLSDAKEVLKMIPSYIVQKVNKAGNYVAPEVWLNFVEVWVVGVCYWTWFLPTCWNVFKEIVMVFISLTVR